MTKNANVWKMSHEYVAKEWCVLTSRERVLTNCERMLNEPLTCVYVRRILRMCKIQTHYSLYQICTVYIPHI